MGPISNIGGTAQSVLVGQGTVPTSPGQMGPLQPTDGLLGSGGKINLESLLSSGLNLASASMQLFAGNEAAAASLAQSRQQARALELSAQEDELAAQEEELRGKQESNDIMDALIQTVASQRLAAAANGVDINFGTPVSVGENTRKIANLQLGITRDDARIRAIARRRQAAARREEAGNVLAAGRQEAGAAKLSAQARAAGTLADLAMRRRERG